jgi:hypothetical protein
MTRKLMDIVHTVSGATDGASPVRGPAG